MTQHIIYGFRLARLLRVPMQTLDRWICQGHLAGGYDPKLRSMVIPVADAVALFQKLDQSVPVELKSLTGQLT